MFAGIACKIGFGMMLALLSQFGGAIAAKTPAERLHDMLAQIARSELNAVQRTCHAVEKTVVDEFEQAGAARALKNATEAVARRVERAVETWQRRVARVVEFVTVKLPARVEATWTEFKAAVTGDERARGDEFEAEI